MPENWKVVEIMGKRSHVGIVAEVQRYGITMLHVKALKRDGSYEEFHYSGAALFGEHDVSEEQARLLVLPEERWTDCTTFKQPSARSGACATCGRPEAAHVQPKALVKPLADRVLDHLRASGMVESTRDIADKLGEDEQEVAIALIAMVDEEKVERAGGGLWLAVAGWSGDDAPDSDDDLPFDVGPNRG